MAQRKTTRRKTGTTAKRRTTKRRSTRKKSSSFSNFFLPLFFIGCILVSLGFLLFMGYQTVTASSFFDFENIETIGIKNVSKEDISKVVKSYAIKDGVWNADIDLIRREIENYKYVKDVSVSRILPDTVRVIVRERIPVALVRLDGNDFWVDKDGLVLNKVKAGDERPPFVMFGWGQDDTGKDFEDNIKRVEFYTELLEIWKPNDLLKRVKFVDLSDLKDVHAIIVKNGKSIELRLGETNFYNRLKIAIETVANSNQCIEYVIVSEQKTFKGLCNK